MPEPIATWNPVRGVWEKATTSLLCEHSEPYLQTWPSSGMTRDGSAYAQPMLVPLTDDSASLSSLPTPRGEGCRQSAKDMAALLQTPSVADGTGGHLTRGGSRSDEPLLAGQVRALLPTPQTSDTNGPGPHGTGGEDLRTAVALLPTPRATRGDSGTETVALIPTPLSSDAGPRGGTTGYGLRDWSRSMALLPTPTSQAAKHAADDRGPGTLDDADLWSVVTRLNQED